jgi:hypothetical protein
MKLKSAIFIAIVIAFVAAVSFYIGGSMRGRNPNQQSIPTPIVETEHSILPQKDAVEETNRKQIVISRTPPLPQTQSISQELRTTGIRNVPASGFTPQHYVDRQLNQLREFYEPRVNSIESSVMPVEEHNALIRRLQAEYDAKKYPLLQVKEQVDTLQKMINEGVITSEAGNEAMWRLVIPERTHEALFPKSNQPENKQQEIGQSVHHIVSGTVTGIIYSEETPLAVIDGKVLHEGQSIRGVKIIKINHDSVEFEHGDNRWSQKVNETPLPQWP